MKLKLGFVTNSSSTSFVVMGANINYDEMTSFVDQEKLKDDLFSTLDEVVQNSDLSYSTGPDYGYGSPESIMVGIHYTRMRDNETLKEFKNRVQLQILERFGVQIQPGHIEVAWMDN
jgi:hypothetical protein